MLAVVAKKNVMRGTQQIFNEKESEIESVTILLRRSRKQSKRQNDVHSNEQ